MIMYLGADHQGFRLKEAVKAFLKDRGYQVEDVGNARYDENDDYPDFAAEVAERVGGDYENSRGILLCGSGVGMSIVANKFRHIRAALVTTPDQAFDSRNDDDANVLVIAANYVTSDTARKILVTWLETPFSREERHRRRLAEIDRIEEKILKPRENEGEADAPRAARLHGPNSISWK